MKKYITIAALLAVGSAFASAETYTWVGTTSDAWGTASNWKLSDGTVATTLPSYTNTTDDTYIIGDGAVVSANDVSVGNLGAKLVVGDSVTLGGNWAFIFKEVEIGSDFNSTFSGDGIKWGIDNNTSTITNSLILNSEYSSGNRILSSIGNGSSINFGTDGMISLSGNGIDLGKGKKLEISASFAVGTSGSLKFSDRILIAGENIWYRDVTTENGAVNYDASKVTSLDEVEVVKYDLAKSTDEAWMLNGEVVAQEDLAAGAYRFYATVEDGIGIQYLSYIPEPSTFGLLAGLGALALVGARRRRK